MIRALCLVLVAAVSLPAVAAPPKRRVRRQVKTVLTCFGFTGLADHAGRMTGTYAAPPTETDKVDRQVRSLVEATHAPKDLLASARQVVSTIPAPLLRAAVAFCHTPAGRAYTRLVNTGTDLSQLKTQAKPDAEHARLAAALVKETHLAEDTRDENLLAVRNAAGARGLVQRATTTAEADAARRRAFAQGFKAQVVDGVQAKLGDRTKEMRQAVERLIGMSLARTPKAQVEAMTRFFRSRAGGAVVQAFGASLHAAMDDAWDRMARRFVAGTLAAQ